jgi:hypothetical protein
VQRPQASPNARSNPCPTASNARARSLGRGNTVPCDWLAGDRCK